MIGRMEVEGGKKVKLVVVAAEEYCATLMFSRSLARITD